MNRKFKHIFAVYLFAFIIISMMACLKVYSVNSAFMDLGTTIETLYFIGVHNEFDRIFLGHIQPFLLFFSIPYKIANGVTATYITIGIQTLIILFPIFKINKEFGAISTLIYLCNPIIYFLAFSTFHIDVIILPMLYLFTSYCNEKKYNNCLFIALLIIFLKETFAPIAVICGIYIFFKSKHKLKSTVLILFGITYFFVSVFYIIPYFNISDNKLISGYEKYGTNILDIFISLLTHFDGFIIDIISNPLKIKLLLTLAIVFPLIFIKFQLLIILTIPIFIMLLSSNNANYYSFGHHYLAPILPIFIYITFLNIQYCNRFKKYYLYYSIIICVAISPAPLSRLFFSSKIDNFSYTSYISTDRDKKISEILRNINITKDLNLVISIQNNILIPELHVKYTMLLYPSGVFEPMVYPFKGTYNSYKLLYADYVILDTKRQPFLYDKGCNYYYKKCTDLFLENNYNRTLFDVKKQYSVFIEYDGFYIFKKKI